MSFWGHIVSLLPELKAYARAVTRYAEDTDDLVNDAIERAAKSPNKPEDPQALKPWMFQVIRNLYVDELRKKRTRREYQASVIRLSSEQTQPRASVENTVLVSRAFEALAPRDREILFLVDMMELTYKETATVLDIPVGTVMSRISRARRALIDKLGQRADDRHSRVVKFRK